ncbi:MAG: sulfotransferase domain-containing protein [Gammaproteobacteria bacterium]
MVTSLRFHYHRLRHEASNFSLLKSRHAIAQLVSQHQSGTHWIKYMLANALANHFNLPGPQYNHANDFIGGPKDDVVYPQIPRLISSHSIPPLITPVFMRLKILHWPRYVLLVRDIRSSLVSNFRKWEERYAEDFSDYLRGDPAGRKYNSDIWWTFRFLNAWGKINQQFPHQLLVVHYEKVLEDSFKELDRINQFVNLGLEEDDLLKGIAAASKQKMIAKSDPARPRGEVNRGNVNVSAYFSPDDRIYFENRCQRFLKYSFGYDYRLWA